MPLERHVFRNLEQAADESIEKFVLRLHEQGNLCEYGSHLDEIKEQIFEKCSSDDLRAKILTKPQMSLAETVELGKSLETIEKHKRNPVNVNKISSGSKSSKTECFRCGRTGHFANDEDCPAKHRKCERCGLTGHFKRRCKLRDRRIGRKSDSDM
nr:uncharacterized protein LOC115260774 [Aedes albopictus]